jgi:hypothetical protein
MKHFTAFRLAQASVGLLLLIVIRTLGQVLWSPGTAATSLGEGERFYVMGAFFAALAAIVAFVFHAVNRNRLSILLTAVTLVALLVYKLHYLVEYAMRPAGGSS